MKQPSTFEFERKMQGQINVFYRSRGWQIDRSGACREYDLILAKQGLQHKVEEKFIAKTGYANFLIELIQDIPTGNVGWYSETRCDFLHYVYCTGKDGVPVDLYRIRWKPFREYFESEVLTKSLTVNICRENFGITLNVFCNWQIVIDKGYAEYFPLGTPLRESA